MSEQIIFSFSIPLGFKENKDEADKLCDADSRFIEALRKVSGSGYSKRTIKSKKLNSARIRFYHEYYRINRKKEIIKKEEAKILETKHE